MGQGVPEAAGSRIGWSSTRPYGNSARRAGSIAEGMAGSTYKESRGLDKDWWGYGQMHKWVLWANFVQCLR